LLIVKINSKIFDINIKNTFIVLKKARNIDNSDRQFLVTIILFRSKNRNTAVK